MTISRDAGEAGEEEGEILREGVETHVDVGAGEGERVGDTGWGE